MGEVRTLIVSSWWGFWEACCLMVSIPVPKIVLMDIQVSSAVRFSWYTSLCRGVKFCGLSNADELFGTQVTFTSPGNHKDSNCVDVVVVKAAWHKLAL